MTTHSSDDTERLRRALVAIKRLQTELEQATRAQHEPIAILGVGCRLPGEISSPEAYWELLAAGRCAIAQVPRGRWDLAGVAVDPSGNTPGTLRHDVIGAVRDIDRFDPECFGLSPREAQSMDPQQRILLEVCWEAFDRAALAREGLADSRTSVFMGMSWNDFAGIEVYGGSLQSLDSHLLTGAALSTAVGRVSYLLGLRGPSLVVDTACSSSLVAVHLACDSLRRGESELALAGGVSLILHPAASVGLSGLGALSPRGRCASFDADADGYVRGEGAVVFVLKLLRAALRDRDPILAVVRGSAVNQDGRSNGMTAPNRHAQQEVLRAALVNARLKPAEVTLVEAHGTGTPLGDPIEASALHAVLHEGRPPDQPVWLGSAKPNIGHLEPAAGGAGLLKAALSLRHEALPPLANFRRGNPHVPWHESCLRVPTALQAWPHGRPRIAGVSAFGLSGTNAHVVLEAAPARERAAVAGPSVCCLAASSAESVRAWAGELARVLAAGSVELAELCFTSQTRRSRAPFRAALAAATSAELCVSLEQLATGQRPVAEADDPSCPAVFVFSGQGGQWQGMARELVRDAGEFSSALQACHEAVEKAGGPSVHGELARAKQDSQLGRTSVVQPLLFAVQVALARMLMGLGVRPAAVVGHSLGEVAAAHIAGALSLEDAARVICRRSELIERLRGGAMALVEQDAESTSASIGESGLWIAAHNGPRSTVVAGERRSVEAWVEAGRQRGLFCRLIDVDYASHGPAMEPLRGPLTAALAGLCPMPTAIPMWSTTSGEQLVGTELDGSYWYANLSQPVLLRRVIERLCAGPNGAALIEMTPHPVLLSSLQDACAQRRAGVAIALQHRERPSSLAVWEVLARLWELGLAVDWRAAWTAPALAVSLPPVPFARRISMARERALPGAEAGRTRSRPERWLSMGAALPNGQLYFEADCGTELGALGDAHRARGAALVPGAYYLELLREVCAAGALHAADVVLPQPLPAEPERRVHVLLRPERANERSAIVYSSEGSTWQAEHCTARLLASGASTIEPTASAWSGAGTLNCSGRELYERMAQRGFDYGPLLRAVTKVEIDEDSARCQLSLAHVKVERLRGIVALDAALHGLFSFWDSSDALLPFSIDELYLSHELGRAAWSELRVTRRSPEGLRADVVVRAAEGTCLASLRGLETRARALTDLQRAGWEQGLEWRPISAPVAHGTPRSVLLISDEPSLAASLPAAFATRGVLARCVAISAPGEVEALLTERAAHEPVVFAPVCAGVPSESATFWAEVTRRVAAALLQTRERPRPALAVVTRSLAEPAAGTAETPLAQLALPGLLRVLASEHPELGLRRIDLELDARAAAQIWVDELLAELALGDLETEVARRGGTRLGARLIEARVSKSARAFAARADRSYLVSGGLGGLGLKLAAWLVEQGAGRVVLNGRSAPSAAAAAQIDALRARGAQVEVCRFDLAERAELDAAWSRVTAGDRPLGAVFHLAGTLQEAAFLRHDEALWRRVLRGKVDGAWNLHRKTEELALDAFVLFSSASASLGMPGQASYAAANSFLDALACLRVAGGRVATSIAWGAFADVGMVAERIASGALGVPIGAGLRTEQAFTAMAGAIASGVPCRMLTDLDPARILSTYPQLAALPHWQLLRTATARPSSERGQLRGTLAAMHPARRASELKARVLAHIAQVLRIELGASSRQRSFAELGLDSMMGLEIRNRLEHDLELALPASLLWNFRRQDELVEFLLGQLFPAAASGPATQDAGDRLSQLAAQLERELGGQDG